MNDILKPFKEYFTMNKNGEYSHLKRTMLTVFHVRFVFVLFETLGFCKSVRVVFPDLQTGFEKVYGQMLSSAYCRFLLLILYLDFIFQGFSACKVFDILKCGSGDILQCFTGEERLV